MDKAIKSMIYKKFDKNGSKSLQRQQAEQANYLKQYENEANLEYQGFNSDDVLSQSDGNHSECDEINIIQKLKMDALVENEDSEINQQEISKVDQRQSKLTFHNFFSRKINNENQE